MKKSSGEEFHILFTDVIPIGPGACLSTIAMVVPTDANDRDIKIVQMLDGPSTGNVAASNTVVISTQQLETIRERLLGVTIGKLTGEMLMYRTSRSELYRSLLPYFEIIKDCANDAEGLAWDVINDKFAAITPPELNDGDPEITPRMLLRVMASIVTSELVERYKAE